MIVMSVEYHVKPGKMQDVLQGLKEMSVLVKAEEIGCLGYQVLRPHGVENRLLLVESYIDEMALEDHRKTVHFKNILEAKVIPLLDDRVRNFYTAEVM